MLRASILLAKEPSSRASPCVSSARLSCRSASCVSRDPASVDPSMSRCLAISFESFAKNCLTSSFVLVSCRLLSPDSSRSRSSLSFSIAEAWLVPAFNSCPFSSSCTIPSSLPPTSWSRACSNALRNKAERRGSLAANRSANRRNVFSRSRNCWSSSCSLAGSAAAEDSPALASWLATTDRSPPRRQPTSVQR